MIRITVCVFTITLLLASLLCHQCLVTKQVSAKGATRLDGVYEFISEVTVLTEPRKETSNRTSSEWTGIWQFHDGYYTRILMKKRRPEFYNSKSLTGLGFESFAGHYEIRDDSVGLEQAYAFNPMNVGRTMLLNYKIEDDTLVLTEKLNPSVEDIRRGSVTTKLRRIK